MMTYVVLCVIFSIMIGVWAEKWERSFVAFSLLSITLTPLVGAAFLLIMGKKVEQEDVKEGPDEVAPTDTAETIIVD